MERTRVIKSASHSGLAAMFIVTLYVVSGCASNPPSVAQISGERDPARLLIVDCLLPGQVRQLGSSLTYLTPRRPVKVPTSECEIRGGEYVAYDRANFSTALKIWLPKAEDGDAAAQTYVGEIFEKGMGLTADPVVAAQWYQRAADQGFSRAKVNLGYLYESGIGVERDLVKAMNFYRSAGGFEESNLEYVSPIEIAARQQLKIDLNDLRRDNAELKRINDQLTQEQEQLKTSERQVESLRAEVARQREVVLLQTREKQAAASRVDDQATQLADALEQLETLTSELTQSESSRASLQDSLQAQQTQTEQLRADFNSKNASLNEANENLQAQQQLLTQLQAQAESESASTEQSTLANQEASLAQLTEINLLRQRLDDAERKYDEQSQQLSDSERSLAQKNALLQSQIADARSREQLLKAELERSAGRASLAELSTTELRAKYTVELNAQATQLKSLRRQLSASSSELLRVQNQLEETELSLSQPAADLVDAQRQLQQQRETHDDRISNLQTDIASARTREQGYRQELVRLSDLLSTEQLLSAQTAANAAERERQQLGFQQQDRTSYEKEKRELDIKISQQQSRIANLEQELGASVTQLADTQTALDESRASLGVEDPELAALREQLVVQRQEFDSQIQATLQQEASVNDELERVSSALASAEIDGAQLRQRLQEQLNSQKSQTEALAGRLTSSTSGMQELRSQLAISAQKYASQSLSLNEMEESLAQQQQVLELQAQNALAREDQLQSEIERLSIRATDAELRSKSLESDLSAQRLALNTLQQQYEESSRQLAASNSSLGATEGEINALQEQLSGLRVASVRDLEAEKQISAELKKQLEDAQFTYASLEVEVKKLRNNQSDSSRQLEQQLAEATRREADFTAQLDQSTDTIEQLQQRLERQESQYLAQIDWKNSEIDKVRDELFGKDAQLDNVSGELQRIQEANVDSEIKLVLLEQTLDETTGLIAAKESEISRLQTEVTRAQAAAEKPAVQQIAAVVNSGPAIEIIQPDVTVTRGGPALKLASRRGGLDLIGKVDPAEDLLAFKIDDEDVSINRSGVFKHQINTPGSTLRLIAINNSGEKTDLQLAISKATAGSGDASSGGAAGSNLSSINFGKYHALIIGNNNHEHIQNLRTAENDAIAIESLLREKFGFETKLLLNATRGDILNAFNGYRKSLTSEDNLIIYYAGHGELAFDKGFWMPVDAEPDNDTNWIPNQQITQYIETMNAKHVMVIADSCYSGTLSRSSLAKIATGMTPSQEKRWYEKISSSKVRTVFTSGGVKPVLDSVGNSRHSVFSAAFLDELETAQTPVVSAYNLFLKVQARVKEDAERIGEEQNPQYSPMKFAGHETGEFLFVQKRFLKSASNEVKPSDSLPFPTEDASKVASR